MMTNLLNVYYRMPQPMRSVMATGYGYMVRSRRYGKLTRELVNVAHKREQWSAQEWREWQEAKLYRLLDHAATRVPYYRQHWQERRAQGDLSSWLELENWPVLRKDAVRERPEEFIAEGLRHKLYWDRTSGSTGKPIKTWKGRRVYQEWYGLVEARWRNWYGVTFEDRWAIFGGRVVTPFGQENPPYWVWNAGMNQLYLSSFHVKPQNTQHYLDALREHRIEYILGYTSSIYALAQQVLEQGLQAPKLRVVVTNGEPLLDQQRRVIEQAFSCPARVTYGMSEKVAAASECEAGNLHLWPEVGCLEVLDDSRDVRVAPGVDGRIVSTSLLNTDMPLIRYEVGDRGALGQGGSCECGRSLPLLERVVGRLSDTLLTRDGRRVFYLYPVFFELPIKEAQVIQEGLDLLRVRLVPAGDYGELTGKEIVRRLRQRLGDVRVEIELVEHIEREATGKFRAVICKVEGTAVRA